MKLKLIAIAIVLVFTALTFHASAQMGYRRDPWGGNKWTGPGAPPHWSPEGQYRYNNPPSKKRPKSKHPSHYPKYPKYKSSHRGSSGVVVGVGLGGWFITSRGSWGWHDKRRGKHTYFKKRIRDSRYIIVDRPVYVDTPPPPPQTIIKNNYIIVQPRDHLCAQPPKVTYDAEGAPIITFDRVPRKCKYFK
jgi:hypothetical protein